MKISDMSLAERDEYVCRQSAAVMRASGYDMPEPFAIDYFLEMDEVSGLRFDVLQVVFDCIAFTLLHKRDDTAAKEAMENILIETRQSECIC